MWRSGWRVSSAGDSRRASMIVLLLQSLQSGVAHVWLVPEADLLVRYRIWASPADSGPSLARPGRLRTLSAKVRPDSAKDCPIPASTWATLGAIWPSLTPFGRTCGQVWPDAGPSLPKPGQKHAAQIGPNLVKLEPSGACVGCGDLSGARATREGRASDACGRHVCGKFCGTFSERLQHRNDG